MVSRMNGARLPWPGPMCPTAPRTSFLSNVVDNSKKLDRAYAPDHVGYAVFGKVTEGMDVVDKIRRVPTDTAGPHENVPVDDVIIKSIRRVDKEKEK